MIKEPKPDIIAVLQDYGVDVRDGFGWIAVRCPFHGDTTASASVNAEFGKFNCHGCEVHGDAWDIIQEHENCTLKEAIEIGKKYSQSGLAAGGTTQTKQKPTHKPRGRRGRV